MQQIVASGDRSDPDIDVRMDEVEAEASRSGGATAAEGAVAEGGGGEEYIMQLTPHEGARLTNSRTALSTVMRLAGVRLQVTRPRRGNRESSGPPVTSPA